MHTIETYRISPNSFASKSVFPTTWLAQSGFQHLLSLAFNILGYIVYEYLDVVENETPDEAGKRIANALGV